MDHFRREAMKQTIVGESKENKGKKKSICRCACRGGNKKKKQLYGTNNDGLFGLAMRNYSWALKLLHFYILILPRCRSWGDSDLWGSSALLPTTQQEATNSVDRATWCRQAGTTLPTHGEWSGEICRSCPSYVMSVLLNTSLFAFLKHFY